MSTSSCSTRCPSTRKRKSKKLPANTKNLVNQIKPIFKAQIEGLLRDKILSEIQIYDLKILLIRLSKEVNIDVLRSCLQNPNLNARMMKSMQSGHLIKMVTSSRKQYRSYANVLIYLNKIMNAVMRPALMNDGYWTKTSVIQSQEQYLDSIGLYFNQEKNQSIKVELIQESFGNEIQKDANRTAEELYESGFYSFNS